MNGMDKEAIETLNYIGWINGSDYRIPENAKLDLYEQAIIEDKNAIKI